MSKLDISQFAAVATFALALKTADGELFKTADGQQISITLYGPGTKAFAKAKAKQSERQINRMRNTSNTKISAEEQIEQAADFLTACTVSLDNFEYKGANDETAIHALYSDIAMGFIKEQVDQSIGNWANFMKGSTQP